MDGLSQALQYKSTLQSEKGVQAGGAVSTATAFAEAEATQAGEEKASRVCAALTQVPATRSGTARGNGTCPQPK